MLPCGQSRKAGSICAPAGPGRPVGTGGLPGCARGCTRRRAGVERQPDDDAGGGDRRDRDVQIQTGARRHVASER